MKKAIGIFDSGIGGLTVLREIKNLLPSEDTIYLGDTARVPYGTKSKETVIRYSIENSNFLMKKGIKLLVIACNTASAFALDELSESLAIPVIGVIESGSRKAVEVTRTNRIGVIGTEGTIRSGAYFDAIKRLAPKVAVFNSACPLFVPLAEEGWLDNKIAMLTAKFYLEKLVDEGVDTVVLGCTHYPLLKGIIANVMGNDVTLVDSAEETAAEVATVLQNKGLLNVSRKRQSNHVFFVTDSPKRFIKIGRSFFGEGLDEVRIVTLED
ncbi:MAG: glutamate racemase [Thermodesulfobacteriota bacterium]